MSTNEQSAPSPTLHRGKGYLVYLMAYMGLVASMDQYLSTVKTTAIPYVLKEYGISAARFSWLEALYLISSFFIFALNGLNDIIGRKWAILVLVLLMGLASLGILVFTPSLHLFMLFYALAIYATVSNMWTIPISEESPTESRARNVSIVYVIGLLPLQALLPPLLIARWGLDWRWMYGAMFVLMIPLLVMWLFMRETHRYNRVSDERTAGRRRRHLFGLGVIDRHDLRYILISAGVWLAWLTYQVLYYWAGYYFMTLKGYSLSQWSLVLLGTLVMAMLGGAAGGWLMDRIGRNRALILGCLGLALFVGALAYAEGIWLPLAAAVSGFFTSFSYTWIVVFVPEIFPTERRGACMGWTTTLARVSYVAGPALAAVLLNRSPDMQLFWLVTAAVGLLPIAIVLLFSPHETREQALEEIEVRRRR